MERESALEERGDDGSHDSTTPVTGFTVTFGDGDNCWRGESIELEVTPWYVPQMHACSVGYACAGWMCFDTKVISTGNVLG